MFTVNIVFLSDNVVYFTISKHFMFTVNLELGRKSKNFVLFQNISCLRLIKSFTSKQIIDSNFKTFHVYG